MKSKLVGISDKGWKFLNNTVASRELIKTYVNESRKAEKGQDFHFSLNGNNLVPQHKNIKVTRVTSIINREH